MVLALYNTLARKKEPFVPLRDKRYRIYDCGPTVWAEQHIGNLYRYIVSDVLRRAIQYSGYELTEVMNITDVGAIIGDVDAGEDRMAVAARREGLDPLAVAQKYTDLFFADEARLNIEPADIVSKATEHIPEMQALIQTLIDKGNAYVAADGVYFDVSSWPDYGKLSKKPLDELVAGARIEVNPNKRNPADFALWRGAKPDDLQQWPSPWGPGKPGWHIECSAMAMKYLGPTLDLHSGGEDHIFPHHECEIAQSEAATGKPFSRCWMHVYFLRVEGQGMHKSIGNVYTVSDIIERGYDPLAFRLLALGAHYRTPLNFTWESLGAQQERLVRWRSNLKRFFRDSGASAADELTADLRDEFLAAIEDDLNTASALAVVEKALHRANLAESREERAAVVGRIFDLDRVLGLSLREAALEKDELTAEETRLLRERDAARAAKDWRKADVLRAELLKHGIRVHDEKNGTTRWERI
ncbi:MAG: cysteine--tRNA ligase [Chloroflexi bacterium 13_1_40CM_4_68_4]|nr:MAG: cysteine--tRNA ligase [Chloroflexi bacterium 13_1_40CM_4_68_4]